MKIFERAFYQCIEEDVSVGSALGGSPAIAGMGNYAIDYSPGDHRLPTGPGKKKKKRKKSKKSKKKVLNAKKVMGPSNPGGVQPLMPMLKRPIIGIM